MKIKYLLVADMGSSRTKHGNLHPVDLFNIILSLGTYIWKIRNDWSLSSKVLNYLLNNIQATISAFWLVKSMSINPKSVQKSEIECKKVKLSAKKWNWVENGEIKMIDSSYFKLRQTKWRTKIKQRLKLFI